MNTTLLKELAYPDPTIDYAAGQACAICPPPEARKEFYNYIYSEILDLYCDHDDSAVQIAEYILGEIQSNSWSDLVENLYIMNRVGASPAALDLWRKWVNTGAPWDHKPKIYKKFNSQGTTRPLDFEAKKNTISKSHYFKYKNHDYFYDVFSNIHYGYVGLKAGFSQKRLLIGSNVQQFFHDINPFGEGDTQSDKIAIEVGFALYEKTNGDPALLTPQDIIYALEQAPFKIDKESKQTHWCWHEKNSDKKLRREDYK